MNLHLLILSLYGLFLGEALGHKMQNTVIHGSTVVIYPSNSTSAFHPGEARLDTINFYCYVGPTGYFSFGWYLGGDPQTLDSSRCTPDATRYDWYEYANPNPGLDCTDDFLKCRTHSVGYYAGWDGKPDRPMVDYDYKIFGFQIGGNNPAESLWTSYYDQVGGMMAVGVRRPTTKDECEAAYKTLLKVYDDKKPPIDFDLTYPCGGEAYGEVKNGVEGVGLYTYVQEVLVLGSMWKRNVCGTLGFC
ncbi:hypothetical protein K440DRAFT_664953 [Wilcoxina mikolae CBS 423.85]|nr:hypothetical protein K440DRAFT_664953 [Wilcoxina mikolae CBS 423.85]